MRISDLEAFSVKPDQESSLRESLPEALRNHLDWLKTESNKHNLTRVPERDWLVRHVLDSLVPVRAGWNLGSRFLDLGTGPGFPGIPIAVYNPECRFSLLESRKKIALILEDLLEQTGLAERGMVLRGRSEEWAHHPDHRERYSRVVVRAVASIPVLIEVGVPFLENGGELWCWKSGLGEIPASEKALRELGCRVEESLRYRLPGEQKDRFVIRIRRTGATLPDRYPRGPGIPQKRPL